MKTNSAVASWQRARKLVAGAGCLVLAGLTVSSHCLMAQAGPEKSLPVFRLPSFFSDNMVLQQEKSPRIWGWAAAEATVTVAIAGQQKTAKAGADGKWKVELDPLAASATPLEMTLSSGTENRVIRNILVGEVWLCSGQSNMQVSVSAAANAQAELSQANDPQMRFFVTAFHAPDQPAEDCGGKWVECSPKTAASFSAVGYFFGRALRQELKVPVGLILSAQGATAAESWISREALKSEPALQPIVDNLSTRIIDPNGWDMHLPSGLFNGRIKPLAPLALRGVIWYQGETNSSRAWQYRKLFPLLIEDWRKTWGEDLPFYFVQLANHLKPQPEPVNEAWAELREAQTLALKLPNTGMAVAIDIGEEKDIHPKNKQDVGVRLAALALSKTYGKKGTDSGPLYQSMKVEGDKIRILFDATGTGLEAKGGVLKQFAVAGADKKFVWAEAVIDGNAVVVSSPQVPQPVAVRYAWANNPEGCNLYNKEGFPASPFRTDDWAGVTETAHLTKPGAAAPKPPIDPPLSPSAGMTGNTLEIDLAVSIDRTWDQSKANGYHYGPRQKKDANGDLLIWLPYGNDRGLYHEITAVKLLPTAPGEPASLVYEGGGQEGVLVLKFRFSAPIGGFRLSCGPVDFQLDGAVAGFEYSVDGQDWKPFFETVQGGQIPRWVDPKGPSATGLDTRDLYLRCYVRGKEKAAPVSAGTRLKARMAGDVMWGDASSTFPQAQWQLTVTPKGAAK